MDTEAQMKAAQAEEAGGVGVGEPEEQVPAEVDPELLKQMEEMVGGATAGLVVVVGGLPGGLEGRPADGRSVTSGAAHLVLACLAGLQAERGKEEHQGMKRQLARHACAAGNTTLLGPQRNPSPAGLLRHPGDACPVPQRRQPGGSAGLVGC